MINFQRLLRATHPRATRRLKARQNLQYQALRRDRRRRLSSHNPVLWGILLTLLALVLVMRPWSTSMVSYAQISPDKIRGIHPSTIGIAQHLAPLSLPLSTRRAEIIDASGKPVLLRGVNWFGIETENHAPHGLWARDYKEMLQQIKTLGYNTIRLPFSLQSLQEEELKGIDYSIGSNQELLGKKPIEVMDAVIQEAGRQGLLILLDSHRLNDQRIPELWYGDGFTEEDWIARWQNLAERYKDQPNVIGADLKNEPHGRATWGTGDRTTDWRLAAERAGNAILQINPKWLIVVEGVEEGFPHAKAKKHWMGGNLEGVKRFPVRLDLPNQLVYSPHEYGPGVFNHKWFRDPSFPKNLSSHWETSFFYIHRQGIAPLFIGEFGGRKVDSKSAEGIWQNTFVDFLQKNNLSFAYWSLNPNSGDTGGILMDDWKQVQAEKQSMLNRLLPAPDPGSIAGTIRQPNLTAVKTPTTTTTTTPTGKVTDLKLTLNPQSEWKEGFCLGIKVENPSNQSVNPWQVQFQMQDAKIDRSWNGNYDKGQSNSYTITPDGWGQTIQPKQTIDLGFCAQKTGKNYRPENWSLR